MLRLLLLAACMEGALCCLIVAIAAPPSEAWRFQATSPIIGTALTANGSLILSTAESVYALDGATGAIQWTFNSSNLIQTGPLVGRDSKIYIGTTYTYSTTNEIAETVGNVTGSITAIDGNQGKPLSVTAIATSPFLLPESTTDLRFSSMALSNEKSILAAQLNDYSYHRSWPVPSPPQVSRNVYIISLETQQAALAHSHYNYLKSDGESSIALDGSDNAMFLRNYHRWMLNEDRREIIRNTHGSLTLINLHSPQNRREFKHNGAIFPGLPSLSASGSVLWGGYHTRTVWPEDSSPYEVWDFKLFSTIIGTTNTGHLPAPDPWIFPSLTLSLEEGDLVIANGPEIARVEPTQPKYRWRRTTGFTGLDSGLITTRDSIIVSGTGSWGQNLGSYSGIRSFRTDTGAEQWCIIAGPGHTHPSSLLLDDHGMLYLSADNVVISFQTDHHGIKSTPWPMSGQNSQRTYNPYHGKFAPHAVVAQTWLESDFDQPIKLSCATFGSPPLELQWHLSEMPLQGETNSEVTVSIPAADQGRYHVTVTNPVGSHRSDTVTVVRRGSPQLLIGGQQVTEDLSVRYNALLGMTTSFEDGVIFYSLDGSMPTTDSPDYEQPIPVANELIVNAVAYSKDLTQSARFGPVRISPVETRSLLVAQRGQGRVVGTAGGEHLLGTGIQLTAVPEYGWRFLQWEGDIAGTEATLAFTIQTDTDLSAVFVPAETFSLDMERTGNGRVAAAPARERYLPGEEVLIKTSPEPGWRLARWEGDVSGADPVVRVRMDGNRTARPVFEPIPTYTVVASGGGGLVSGSGAYPEGSTITVSATPLPGWTFSGWTGDHVSVEPTFSWTVLGPATFRAIFTTTISNTVTGPGQISLQPHLSTYPFGTRVRVSPVPEPGHFLALWGEDAAGQARTGWSFVLTNATPRLSALFSPLSAGQVTLQIGRTGEGDVLGDPGRMAFAVGEAVRLQAIPWPGHVFSKWSGDAAGSGNPLDLVLTDSLRITAEFLPAPPNLPPIVVGWTPLAHASRFAIVEGAFTWDEARAEALAMGGHLATFSTEAEWTVTTPMRQAVRSPHWIGGMQSNAPESSLSEWTWITDEPWGFSAWSPAEPNDYLGTAEDRLEVFEYGAWNDADASIERGFMVEFATGDSSPLVSSVSVTEGETLALALKAGDPDGASDALTTQLLSGPEGLFLNSSGTLIWQPAEGQGPASHLISFVVTDGGTPPAASTNTLQILVTETNHPPQFEGDRWLTFGSFTPADGILISSNASPLVSTGGNPGGFLPLTFATTNQYSVLVTSPDQSAVAPVVGFRLSCDVRSGNGTYERNADGMSFSFPRVGDPVLLNPQDQSGFAGGCCAETGTGTGLAVSFDTWSGNLFPHSPGDTNDVEGILVRVDNETVAKIPLPIRNGSPDDPASLQTGPRDPGYWSAGRSPWSHEAWDSLAWRPLLIQLTPDGKLSIEWKSVRLLDGLQIAAPPLDGRLVIAGRAEWANANLHLDNLRLDTVRHHQSVEGSPVAIALGASDPDRPAQLLQYQLLEAPPGATITETGILQWNPDESAGGSTNVIVVQVNDSGAPPMSATNRIRLVILEDNQPPVVTSSEVAEIVEGSALQAAITAVDADMPAQILSFSLIAGPPELTLGADGRLNWTPSEDQGPSTNDVVVRVCDDGVPSLCVTNGLRIRVREANQPPLFTSLPPFSVTEGESLTGNLMASDRDRPLQDLTFSLVSGPIGFLVRADGSFVWNTGEEHGPAQHEITVSVADNGEPPLSATYTFQVSVAEENVRPVLEAIPDLVAVEHTLLQLPLAGHDSDLPPQSLTYRLEGAPEGMILNPLGLLEWRPSEVQGDSTNRVLISLSDDGSPSLSASVEFLIVVLETNAPPTLAFPDEVRLDELQPLTLLLEATDMDDPAQSLTYALVEGPEGLSISQTGQIQWKPSEAQGPSTNVLTVRISDDGAPPQVVTATTRLIVNEINDIPRILNHGDQATPESDLYRTVMAAVDADIPAQSLSFALVNGPEGVSVTPDGVVEWRPREDQGPSTNVIAISVSDDGVPPLAATNEIVVMVLEVNLPPGIPEIPEFSIVQGIPWHYSIQGEDPDLPPQRLSFRLMSGPAGLNVADNGDMDWTPERWQSPSRNAVVVEVSDDGVPLLSQQFAFTVEVKVPEEIPEILIAAESPTGNLQLEIRAKDGQRLVLENAAEMGAWQEVQQLTGLGKVSPVRVNIVVTEDASRYWRVLVGTR